MKCPECGGKVFVDNTRPRADNTTYRRYECVNDGRHRFSTREQVVDYKGRGPQRKEVTTRRERFLAYGDATDDEIERRAAALLEDCE